MRLVLVSALASLVAACGVPIKVAKVTEPTAVAKGIRYRIKRPAYTASLRLNPDAENRYEVIVTQVLKDAGTYEATTHPHPLADTEISIVTEDDGALVSVSAGEKDRTLETITAAIGLATSIAAATVSDQDRLRQQCGRTLLKAISDLFELDAEYGREEAYAEAVQARIVTLTNELKQALTQTPVDPRRAQALRRERNRMLKDLAAAKSRLEALRSRTVPLSDTDFRVIVESGTEGDPPSSFGSGTCLTITLTPKAAL